MPAPLLIAALAGLGFQVYGQSKKRDAEADQLDKAARNLYTEAAQTARAGEYAAWANALDLEQRLGAFKVAAAVSGVDAKVGSVATAARMTETFGRLDVQMTRLNAARKARGIRAHADQSREAADELRSQGPLEGLATVLGGGASIFSKFA